MLDEKVDLVAVVFNGLAWLCDNRINISTIEEAFADACPHRCGDLDRFWTTGRTLVDSLNRMNQSFHHETWLFLDFVGWHDVQLQREKHVQKIILKERPSSYHYGEKKTHQRYYDHFYIVTVRRFRLFSCRRMCLIETLLLIIIHIACMHDQWNMACSFHQKTKDTEGQWQSTILAKKKSCFTSASLLKNMTLRLYKLKVYEKSNVKFFVWMLMSNKSFFDSELKWSIFVVAWSVLVQHVVLKTPVSWQGRWCRSAAKCDTFSELADQKFIFVHHESESHRESHPICTRDNCIWSISTYTIFVWYYM